MGGRRASLVSSHHCSDESSRLPCLHLLDRNLYLPDALASLKERNEPVLTDLQNFAELGCNDGSCCASTLDGWLALIDGHGRTQDGPKRQEIRLPIQHNRPINPGDGLEDSGHQVE